MVRTESIVKTEQRDGRWWVYTYVHGAKKYYGPYPTEADANTARLDVARQQQALQGWR